MENMAAAYLNLCINSFTSQQSINYRVCHTFQGTEMKYIYNHPGVCSCGYEDSSSI